MPFSSLSAIIMMIVSGLLIASGVALMFMGDPGVSLSAALKTSTLISAGAAGISSSINGIVKQKFEIADCLLDMTLSAGITMITIVAGYSIGSVTGIAL